MAGPTKSSGGAALLLASWLLPMGARAQAADAPPLTPTESEAYEMSVTLASGCNPRRHGLATGSESTIERDGGALAGTAVYFRNVDGSFVVLEEYDEALEGHCLVLGWFGESLAPGRYAVRELAYAALEEELAAEQYSIYGMFAVRTAAESSMFVARTGTLDVTRMNEGLVEGTFELAGYIVQGGRRTGEAVLTGSFVTGPGEG